MNLANRARYDVYFLINDESIRDYGGIRESQVIGLYNWRCHYVRHVKKEI